MIKGIDSQIMIQRSLNYAKQTSDQINNVQQAQDFLVKLEKERSLKEASSVLKNENAKGKTIDERQEERKGGDDQGFFEENGLDYDFEESEQPKELPAYTKRGGLDISI